MEENVKDTQGTQDTPQTPNMTVTTNGQTTTVSVDTDNSNAIDDVVNDKVDDSKDTEDTPDADTQDTKDAELSQSDISDRQKMEDDLKSELSSKGLDFSALEKEYTETGELSKESLEQLDKAGYPKSMVDAYIAGLQAMSDRFINSVYEMAGGKEAYLKVTTFLASQPTDVVKAYNDTIQSGNLGAIKLAISGVQAQMTKTYGTNNPTIMGQPNAGSKEGYTSYEAMIKDMSDPRYQVDPKFTRDVIMKIKNATIF